MAFSITGVASVAGRLSRRSTLGLLLGSLLFMSGCDDGGKKSVAGAKVNLEFVAKAAVSDVGELRRGMPEGAKMMAELFKEAAPEQPAAVDAREALVNTRAKVNDLDSAKSTFFLVAGADGSILRNNLDQDDMAEKNLFKVYPSSKDAIKKDYTEFTGEWEIARGVNGRPDAQWVATSRIKNAEGEGVGILAAGWSWSSYAYRLEMGLRSHILGETESGDKVPVVYVYVVVGDQAYGAPVSPPVNGQAIVKTGALAKAKEGEIFAQPLEVTNHTFGLALKKIPELGDNVAVAVLRSDN